MVDRLNSKKMHKNTFHIMKLAAAQWLHLPVIKWLYIPSLIFILILAAGCDDGGNMKNATIEPEKMIAILSDIHIMEGELQAHQQVDKDSLAQIYYYHIFKTHGVSEKEFYKNYDLYMAQPKKMEQMYDTVIVRLTNLKL